MYSIYSLIYTNGVNPTNSKWNKIINNLLLFILRVRSKEIFIMTVETRNDINESYPIDNDFFKKIGIHSM